jgi:topoisomerase-4 subunit B
VYYALDNADRDSTLEHIEKEKIRGKVSIQRFKGLGEMNPLQLRETTMNPETRSMLQLKVQQGDGTHSLMDMLLAKKRAADRKFWLAEKGDQVEVA